MRPTLDIPRLKNVARLSKEKIARARGVSRGAVCKYLQVAPARNITWPLPEASDEG